MKETSQTFKFSKRTITYQNQRIDLIKYTTYFYLWYSDQT
jgi:hypothetical protein